LPYPVTTNASIQPDSQLELTFRPPTPGLVDVILVGFGIPPQTPPDASAPQPPDYTIRLRLDVFKPGASTPVASTDATLRVNPGTSNRVVASLNTPAGPADLGADWLARVTNFGDGPVACRCSARYQVVPGNLGKIDHVVILMLENRSFDHMLSGIAKNVDRVLTTRPTVAAHVRCNRPKSETREAREPVARAD
jgi:hypothetical protein